MKRQRLTKEHISAFVFTHIPVFSVLSYRQNKTNVQGVRTKLNNTFLHTNILSI